MSLLPTQYDVLVIGAGLGGLSAATSLARGGLSALCLERHNGPGGYATSSVRSRYELEVARHEPSGTGPPEDRGGLVRTLDYLGVADKAESLCVPNLDRSVSLDGPQVPAAGGAVRAARLGRTGRVS
jgi:prolycopene isomerase